MKVILAIVTSLDGKSTKDTAPPFMWASKEDQDFFKGLFKTYKLFVLGRKTYLSPTPSVRPSSQNLKIVLTKNPKRYKKYEVLGQLEFSSDTPLNLVKKLEKRRFKEMLLIGGETITTEFFRAKLINEIWLTLEPKIFGQGKGILKEDLDVKLKLKEINKLNSQGTLLLKYEVI